MAARSTIRVDPDRATGQVQQQQSDLPGGLLGSGGGLGSPLAEAALAGIAATVPQHLLGGRR